MSIFQHSDISLGVQHLINHMFPDYSNQLIASKKGSTKTVELYPHIQSLLNVRNDNLHLNESNRHVILNRI